ncbi:FecR family protein [Pedobacter frigoris]|uniref:FecR family protein n=1 Tax=Pedobacter frigoris TaxID=2571272 RepID=UPI00292D2FE9|nr:FecR family protein [Pedobacter frigoris]
MDNKVKDLLKRFKEGKTTHQEEEMLRYWLHHHNQEGASGLSEADLQKADEDMWMAIKPADKPAVTRKLIPAIAAAAVLLIAVSAGYLFMNKPENKSVPLTVKTSVIKPGGNNAVLTLASGKKIVLNDAATGELAEESGIIISKTADGQLVYTVTSEYSGKAGVNAFNTIETPRGGQYQINLPDGTKVWLNAVSSLRFPARFSGNQRKVELSGEGYFEVAHNKKMPFKVKTADQEVEVLGTHFNINSYPDETETMTTLLEGSVSVNSAIAGSAMLKPGQQSLLSGNNLKVAVADVDAAIAWKNGEFRFNDEKLESIMHKVSRWYNVEVVYQDDKLRTEPFGGVITRFAKVSELLKMLELTQEVKFKIENNTIVVMDGK